MPWIVKEIGSHPAELDLSPSSQGSLRVTQILFDGELFANAAEVTSWDADAFQVGICSACAIEHCERGSWLQLRALGTTAVFVPCFSDLRSNDPLEVEEYAPPDTVRLKGLPVLSDALFSELRSVVARVPTDLAPMTGREAALAVWFEAPPGVFRETAEGPRLESRSLLATDTEAELDGIARALARQFRELLESGSRLTARELRRSDRPIRIFVDDAECTEWTPIAETEDGSVCLCWGGFVLEGPEG